MVDETDLTPSQLNAALRLAAAAKRCDPQLLYDPESFDKMFRWNSFARLDGQVLDLPRRIVNDRMHGKIN
jgi:hypothetical protein